MRTVSLRVSLLRNVSALVLAVSVTVLVVMFAGARKAVQHLSDRLIDQSTEQVEQSLRIVFEGMEALTEASAEWSDHGLLEYKRAEDLDRLNQLFTPILRKRSHITSMMVMHDEGFEYTLLRDFANDQPYDWYNRITWADRGPEAAFIRQYTADLELLSEDELPRAAEYDVRNRPYYALPEVGQTIWTDPYYFFTTRDAGMTVTQKWRDPSGRVRVVAFDLLLMDLSRFTVGLRPTPNGLVFAMFRDGSLLGLPADERWSEPVGQREALRNPEERHGQTTAADQVAQLRTAEEMALPVVASAFEAWEELDDSSAPLIFSADGEKWRGGFRRFALDGPEMWIGVVVPESDLFAQAREQRNIVLAICALALLLSIGLAHRLARRYSRPLEALAEQSARVRELSLTDHVPVDSRITEISQLAHANAQMVTALESFSRYVPLDLVRELLRREEVAQIGGRTETLTILFTDIEGFTAISESMTPQALTLHMAEYFSALLEVLGNESATVDKFIGDAIVAFWGAPAPDPDHAAHAVRAVLRCRHRLEELNAHWDSQGMPPLPTRFGLSTGRVVVGNVGAPERLNYTVLGDTVNTASRLEALNGRYGTWTLATSEVVEQAGPEFLWRRIDRVIVKGKGRPVDVFEPLGLADECDEATVARARRYESALEGYAARRFEESATILESLVAEDPNDGPSARLLERCQQFAAAPPDPSWDGVTRLDRK